MSININTVKVGQKYKFSDSGKLFKVTSINSFAERVQLQLLDGKRIANRKLKTINVGTLAKNYVLQRRVVGTKVNTSIKRNTGAIQKTTAPYAYNGGMGDITPDTAPSTVTQPNVG